MLPLSNATLRTQEITPDELLGAARTIPKGDISTCSWLDHWVPVTKYLEWMHRGLQEGGEYGWSNAIMYAKRAVANRIDVLVRYNHLAPFAHAGYDEKAKGLRELRIRVPDVIGHLVFDPRNDAEHEYETPDQGKARDAADIAHLFVEATEREYERSSIVALGWNVSTMRMIGANGQSVDTEVFGERPMLFIDVFDEPHAAKIVDPSGGEIRYAPLDSFDRTQAIALAKILRASYDSGNYYARGLGGTHWVKKFKEHGGF